MYYITSNLKMSNGDSVVPIMTRLQNGCSRNHGYVCSSVVYNEKTLYLQAFIACIRTTVLLHCKVFVEWRGWNLHSFPAIANTYEYFALEMRNGHAKPMAVSRASRILYILLWQHVSTKVGHHQAINIKTQYNCIQIYLYAVVLRYYITDLKMTDVGRNILPQ